MGLKRVRWGVLIAAAMIAAFGPSPLQAVDDVAGQLIVINDNGGWCWYEGERALIHDSQLLVGSVANSAGPDGTARNGNIEVAACDLATGALSRFVLHAGLQADDHNSPGLLVRPDGRILAMYARHGSDQLTRWRISTNPGDITAWEPEQTFDHGAGCTYSNVYRLTADNGGAGRTYDIARTIDLDPNVLLSSDNGQTWSYGGRLLNWPVPTGDPKFTGSDGSRPYLRYASNGVDEIHFITSEDHPRAYDNSIYHGVIRGGKVYDSFGNVVDDNLFDGVAKKPNEYTMVFNTDTSPLGFAWTTDLRLDTQGRPCALFTARANNNDSTDHRFLYARFDGSAWNVHEIAKAGGYLYATENDYTGLGVLDPRDPDVVYISTKIDPRDGATALAHYEIFKGVTGDRGASWTWTWITANSTMDNLRPIVPPSDGTQEALLWLRGSFSTYTSYNTRVVALLNPPLACATIPAVTPQTPILPGATAVVVDGVAPEAEAVHVYVNGTLAGSATGSPPNTPAALTVTVAPLALNDLVAARQVVGGHENCGVAPEVKVWMPLHINYVDADPSTATTAGNTTINGALVNTGAGGNATAGSSSGSGTDLKWHVRARTTVNGGEVWEAGSAEVPPVLITSLTLPAGTYDLYGLFWNNAANAGAWDIQFRVGSSGPYTTFNAGNAILAADDGSDFLSPVTTRDDAGNFQVLLIAPLGRFVVSSPVNIYVNAADLISGGTDDRTWYDGIGFSPVCNDPFADADGDHDVDQSDFGLFQICFSGAGGGLRAGCACFNRPEGTAGWDNDVDRADLDAFVNCFTGPAILWAQGLAPNCSP